MLQWLLRRTWRSIFLWILEEGGFFFCSLGGECFFFFLQFGRRVSLVLPFYTVISGRRSNLSGLVRVLYGLTVSHSSKCSGRTDFLIVLNVQFQSVTHFDTAISEFALGTSLKRVLSIIPWSSSTNLSNSIHFPCISVKMELTGRLSCMHYKDIRNGTSHISYKCKISYHRSGIYLS